ncbi:MAG: dethiobiotin synthase [Bacteroidetes bacterium]|nr:dethiobiotin synthase [Bacteroidota bacterium]
MKPKFPLRIFITGIGTGVGKTLASAVLCETLQADYWKPVQCGNLENSDAQLVRSLVSNSVSKLHAETYRLKEAASPHFAAKKENVEIEIDKFKLPQTNNRLIIEGAGGIMVPMNNELVMFDLIAYLQLPAVVVVRNYLGSINHALLTLEFLEGEGIEIAGIIVSGENYNDNEEIVQHFTALPVIGRIDEAKTIDKDFVSAQAEKMKLSLSLNFQL